MAVNTTIFSVINGMLLRPMPVPHAEQLAVLATKQEGMPEFQRFRRTRSIKMSAVKRAFFSDVLAYPASPSRLLSADHKVDQAILTRVSGNYFSALGIQAAAGRLILPSEGQTPGADPNLGPWVFLLEETIRGR